MYSNTPATLTPAVLEFCRSVCNEAPIFLRIEPLSEAVVGDCFPLVDRVVQERGGTAYYGWRIWVWPHVMIEAEFHSVWRDPDGVLHDYSPAPFDTDRILFLPDANREYHGEQVNNVRRNLSGAPSVQAFFDVCDEVFEFMNRGGRAKAHGMLTFSGADARELQNLQRRKIATQLAILRGLPRPGRNDPCPCGSGKKFKRCHGAYGYA